MAGTAGMFVIAATSGMAGTAGMFGMAGTAGMGIPGTLGIAGAAPKAPAWLAARIISLAMRAKSSTARPLPSGSRVVMEMPHVDVLEHAEGVVGVDGGRAVQSHQVRGDRLPVDAHE